ncbi:MAG: sulfatase [Coraliomargaritaceae bacterium]
MFANAILQAGPATPPPNIILIYADDLGYGDLGCYGHPTIQTPNLDRMAEEGQKWTQFYSASNICSPSRAALLTGLYPNRIGISKGVFFEWSAEGLQADTQTIAETLQDRGYNTFCVGKWHLGHRDGYLPQDHGFDFYYGIPYSNDMRLDPGMPIAESVKLREGVTLKQMQTRGNKVTNWVPLMENRLVVEYPCDQTTLTKRYTEKALQIIESNKEQPFFLFLSHSMPHVPLFASKDFVGKSKRGLYGDVIEEIDANVGQIFETLKQHSLDKNTLVIFTSDNGPWLNFKHAGGSTGILKGSKGTTWEGGHRVPAIFWWPSVIQPGTVSEIGCTLDFFKTFSALAGISAKKSTAIDSFDLSQVLLNKAKSPRETFFYYRSAEVFAVRYKNWKVHFSVSEPNDFMGKTIEQTNPLLFDLDVNPEENCNLAEKHPEIIETIREMKQLHQESILPHRNIFNARLQNQELPDWAK